ncbi:MAG: transcriptional repressor [Gammaproteobacteria bacterium]|nr:transcriptional repressor [Gammaproteobacteria bacterium]MCP5136203.1 transcriptional repressor [Gammaproteobacteria bacterium]
MNKSDFASGFPVQAHDHAQCVQTMLRAADDHCAARGLRLTALRRQVLELIWSDHKPVGAYALLDMLGEDGRKAAPPTVYRALEFLVEHGLAHRIASLNAFIGCVHPGEAHTPQFFLCRKCGDAAEVDDPRVHKAIAADAHNLDFDIADETVEISGICAQCRGGESA